MRWINERHDPIGWDSRPCLGTDVYLWFGPAEDQPAEERRERVQREAIAKGYCAECLFTQHCLELELRHSLSEQHGVRGGLNAAERRALIRQRSTRHDHEEAA